MAEYRVGEDYSWEATIARNMTLDGEVKLVLFLLALRFSRMGSTVIAESRKDQWVSEIAAESRLSPAQVEARLDKAVNAGVLLVRRLKAPDGSYSTTEFKPVRPLGVPGPYDVTTAKRTVYVAATDTLAEDIALALKTADRARMKGSHVTDSQE